MKRRGQPDAEGHAPPTPAELRSFDPDVWGHDAQAPVRFWQARAVWADEHGEQPDTDPDAVLPDVPFDPNEI